MQIEPSLGRGNQGRVLAAALALAPVMLAVDYASGPHLDAPVVFAFPVVIAAWFGFNKLSLGLAVALPLSRAAIEGLVWNVHPFFPFPAANAVTRILALGGLSVLASRAGLAHRMAHRVQLLEGILPICSFCKRIRDAKDQWQPVEKYVAERSSAAFSHGLCPECAREHYAEYLDG